MNAGSWLDGQQKEHWVLKYMTSTAAIVTFTLSCHGTAALKWTPAPILSALQVICKEHILSPFSSADIYLGADHQSDAICHCLRSGSAQNDGESSQVSSCQLANCLSSLESLQGSLECGAYSICSQPGKRRVVLPIRLYILQGAQTSNDDFLNEPSSISMLYVLKLSRVELHLLVPSHRVLNCYDEVQHRAFAFTARLIKSFLLKYPRTVSKCVLNNRKALKEGRKLLGSWGRGQES